MCAVLIDEASVTSPHLSKRADSPYILRMQIMGRGKDAGQPEEQTSTLRKPYKENEISPRNSEMMAGKAWRGQGMCTWPSNQEEFRQVDGLLSEGIKG